MGTVANIPIRRNDIVLRTKLQSIEDRLQIISQSNPSLSLSSEVRAQPSTIRAIFRVPRRRVRVTHTPIESQSSSCDLVKTGGTASRISHRKSSMITPDASNCNGSNLPPTSYTRPKINIYEQADQALFLDTGNYNARSDHETCSTSAKPARCILSCKS